MCIGEISVYMVLFSTGGTLERERFASFPETNNFEFLYEVGENISQVYPGKLHEHEHIPNSESVIVMSLMIVSSNLI